MALAMRQVPLECYFGIWMDRSTTLPSVNQAELSYLGMMAKNGISSTTPIDGWRYMKTLFKTFVKLRETTKTTSQGDIKHAII